MKRLSFCIMLVFIFQTSVAQNFFYQAQSKSLWNDSNFYQIHPVFNQTSIEIAYDAFFSKKVADFDLTATPQVNLLSGMDLDGNYFAYGLNGMYLRAEKAQKWKLHWFPAIFSGKLPDRVSEFSQNQGVVPGYTYSDMHDFQLQYFQLFHLNYQPNEIFSFALLNEPLKIGNGYYSLFVDDKTSPYWQLRTTAQIWHLKYMVNVSFLRDRDFFQTQTDWVKKYTFTHLLSWNLSKRINFNFFETLIASSYDSAGYRGFDYNYLNPVIFYRPLEFSLGSPDNVLMGIGLNIRLFKETLLYGQILLDEFVLSQVKQMNGWWGNKQAFLGGLRSACLFGIENLLFTGEIVLVRPYVYAHNHPDRVYGNRNQLLAYANGSNTAEVLSEVKYQHKKWILDAFFSYRLLAKDSSNETNLGNHPYKSYDGRNSDYSNEFLQGIRHDVKRTSFNVYYYIWPHWNMYITGGIDASFIKSDANEELLSLFTFGIISNMHFFRMNKHYSGYQTLML